MLDKTIEAIKNVQSRIQDMKEDKQHNLKKQIQRRNTKKLLSAKFKKCM
jgi:hypothetical protein